MLIPGAIGGILLAGLGTTSAYLGMILRELRRLNGS